MEPSKPTEVKQLAPGRHAVAELDLFPRLTRASYLALYGKPAPAFDASRPIQRWFDPSAVVTDKMRAEGDDTYSYNVWTNTNLGVRYRRVNIPVEWAGVPNLPGKLDFAAWKPAPLNGWMPTGDGGRQVPDADGFCTREEALALIAEMRRDGLTVGDNPVLSFNIGPFAVQYDPSERRRAWNISVGGSQFNGGLLLRQRHSNGVDRPGKWSMVGGSPSFTASPDVTGEFDMRPETPVPQRQVQAGESVELGFGATLQLIVAAPVSQDKLDETLVARRVREIHAAIIPQ